jgi:hypothetical protein
VERRFFLILKTNLLDQKIILELENHVLENEDRVTENFNACNFEPTLNGAEGQEAGRKNRKIG